MQSTVLFWRNLCHVSPWERSLLLEPTKATKVNNKAIARINFVFPLYLNLIYFLYFWGGLYLNLERDTCLGAYTCTMIQVYNSIDVGVGGSLYTWIDPTGLYSYRVTFTELSLNQIVLQLQFQYVPVLLQCHFYQVTWTAFSFLARYHVSCLLDLLSAILIRI